MNALAIIALTFALWGGFIAQVAGPRAPLGASAAASAPAAALAATPSPATECYCPPRS